MAFRLANINDRATLVTDRGVYDLEGHGDGFSSDPMDAITRHGELHAVVAALPAEPDAQLDPATLGPPVPRPQKVLGIGLNYRAHAEETGMDIPTTPIVFSKFASCIVGPTADITVFGPTTDWEAEMVVVIGTRGRDIPASQAWEHVAGLTCGQDVSERTVQFGTRPPQFDMGKSFDSFGPTGPCLVSVDQFDDPDNLAIACAVNDEQKQDARTDDLIFGVAALIEHISAVCTMEPGDLIFTGTPSGVGVASQTFLAPDDVVTTTIEGIGTMTNRCVARG